MPTNVLFINKSAKSKHLTRSDGFERSKIFSHVQQSPYTFPEEIQIKQWGFATTVHHDVNQGTNSSYGIRFSNKGSSKGQRNNSLTRRRSNERKGLAVIRYNSPTSVLDTAKLDPFDCAVVAMNRNMTDMLRVYRENLLETVFSSPKWAEAHVHYHLKYASESAELLYAMLCSASGTLYVQRMDTRFVESAMQFKGQALNHLRQSIDRVQSGGSPSIAMIFAMGFQCYLECMSGDVEVARIHYDALVECMANVAVENIPLPMRVGMMIPSFFVSGMLSKRPLLLPVFEGPDEESTSWFEDELLATDCPRPFLHAKAGTSFLDFNHQALMGLKLCQVVDNLRNTQADMIRRSTRKEIRASFTLRTNIEYELLALPFMADGITPEQDVVRLALYLSCKPTLISSPLTATLTDSMATQIYNSLRKSSGSSGWSSCPTLLLWALSIAASICLEGNQRSWITREIAVLRKYLNLETQEEMEEILTGFFYVLDISPTACVLSGA